MALAVLWGSSQSKLDYVESEIKDLRLKKANKDVIEVKLEVMSSDISEIKEMLRELK